MTSPLRIKQIPQHDRPRERLARLGPDALTDAELLAVLLRTGTKERGVLELAHKLLCDFGGLESLVKADAKDLMKMEGIKLAKATELVAALALAKRLCQVKVDRRVLLDSPRAVADLLREEVRAYEVEKFFVLLLNTKNELVRAPVEVTSGTLNASLVHAREVFRRAIKEGAAAVLLAHNHPSGDPTPSSEDIRITRQLFEAGKILGIEVLDHIILGQARDGRPDYISLQELGLM